MANEYVLASTRMKMLTILSYSFLILALIYLFIYSPAKGYEISIYSAILPFWVLIFIAISIGVVSLLYMVQLKKYNGFGYIFLVLMLCFFIVFALPVIRGYVLYGANDPYGHYTRILDILSSGHTGDNYYPIGHIIAAELSSIPSISANDTAMLIAPIFSIIFILFTYYLARAVFNREDYAIMAAVIGLIPLFSYYQVTIYPHALAIFLLPIIFYLYFKSVKEPNYRLIFVIAIILEAFVHVIPSLVIIGAIVSAEIIKYILIKTNIKMTTPVSFFPAIISFMVFFTWWSSYTVFDQVEKTYLWFAGEVETIPRTTEVETVSQSGWQFTVELYSKMYGNQLVLTVIAVLSMLIILVYVLRKKEDLSNALILSGILLASAMIYIFVFLSGSFITVGRLFGANYGVWAMPVVSAFLFAKLNTSKIKLFIIAAVIILLIAVGTLGIYRSDWIYQPNWQITSQDMTAYNWKNEHGSGMVGSGVMGSPWGKLPTGSYVGSQYALIPYHFGYDINHKLGDFLIKDTIIYYGESRQRQASNNAVLTNSSLGNTWALPGFDNADFDKLNYDNSVNFIYSGGEVNILFVRSPN